MLMPERSSDATWRGGLEDGSGNLSLGSGAFDGEYSFASRFESGSGTNPEELIAAAHAGCYSMALSNELHGAGYESERVSTTASVNLNTSGEGPEIDKIHLDAEAEVPGIDEETFMEIANAAKEGCPVSKVLAGAEITLDIELV
jgi:osmotically inducible protein OsmC